MVRYKDVLGDEDGEPGVGQRWSAVADVEKSWMMAYELVTADRWESVEFKL
jgi:hypothetical protein